MSVVTIILFGPIKFSDKFVEDGIIVTSNSIKHVSLTPNTE